jgi:hypothetical protein
MGSGAAYHQPKKEMPSFITTDYLQQCQKYPQQLVTEGIVNHPQDAFN